MLFHKLSVLVLCGHQQPYSYKVSRPTEGSSLCYSLNQLVESPQIQQECSVKGPYNRALTDWLDTRVSAFLGHWYKREQIRGVEKISPSSSHDNRPYTKCPRWTDLSCCVVLWFQYIHSNYTCNSKFSWNLFLITGMLKYCASKWLQMTKYHALPQGRIWVRILYKVYSILSLAAINKG